MNRNTFTPDEWERLNNFWHDMVTSHFHLMFQNPRTSFYWLCVDERNHCFRMWGESWGLKTEVN